MPGGDGGPVGRVADAYVESYASLDPLGATRPSELAGLLPTC